MAKPTKRDKRISAITSGLEHPLRRKLLREFRLDSKGASPKDLAARLREPLTNASYHVRELADKGLVRQKGQQQRRGAVEHFYVLTHDGKLACELLDELEGLIP